VNQGCIKLTYLLRPLSLHGADATVRYDVSTMQILQAAANLELALAYIPDKNVSVAKSSAPKIRHQQITRKPS